MLSSLAISSRRLQVVRTALLALVVAGACVIGVLMLQLSSYGFDFTDEGQYIQVVEDTWRYPSVHHRFAVLYQPLVDLVGSDLASLRRANLWITAIAATVCAAAALRSLYGRALSPAALAAVAFGLSPAALLFGQGIAPTPSYNSATVQGLLIAASGAFLARRRIDAVGMCGWALLGAGGAAVFVAKPTSAALLAVTSAAFLVRTGRWRWPAAVFAAAVACAGVAAVAEVFDGGVVPMIERVRSSSESLQLLRAGYTFLHMLSRFVRPSVVQIIYAAAALAIAAGALLLARRVRVTNGLALLAPLAAVCAGAAAAYFVPALRFGALSGMAVALPALAAGVAVWMQRRTVVWDERRRVLFVETVFLLFLPMVCVFGSNVPYYRGTAGVFWVIGAVGLLRLLPHGTSDAHGAVAACVLAGQLCVALTLAGFVRAPYRQPGPLLQNDASRVIGRGDEPILLNSAVAQYLDDAASGARMAGLPSGAGIIDLTGNSPGLLYHLDAYGVGSAWLVGGYDGSDDYARAVLAQEPCATTASAWVLVERGAWGEISADVLRAFGAELARDYVVAAEWTGLASASRTGRPVRQALYRPTRSAADAAAACAALR